MRIHIASYQPAAKPLADVLGKYPYDVVIRLGGTMPYAEYPIQINSVHSIRNSINKLTQKQLLIQAGLKTLPLLDKPVFPCVVKGIVRSCGTSVKVVRNADEFNNAVHKMNGCGHIIEPLFNATGEYRLHCTRNEVFFAVKKIKETNDIIINHKNHHNVREFPLPRLWDKIKAECLKAMAVLDLDIACFDVMYDSANDAKHEFTIAEANTNPELLHNTFEKYREELTKLIKLKIKEYEYPRQVLPAYAEKPLVADKPRRMTEQEKDNVVAAIMNDEYFIDKKGNLIKL